MADKTGRKEKNVISAAEGRKTEQKYELARLKDNCRELFGVSATVFAGAADRLTGKYSVSDMKEIIKKWSKQEVM